MRSLTRTDAAPNQDIVRAPDDEQSKRGAAIAAALDGAMKSVLPIIEARADGDKPKEEAGESKKIPVEDEDHEGTKIDKILKCLDGISSHVDALHSRMDGFEKFKDGAEALMTDRKKKDAEEEEEKGEPRELKADKKADAYTDSYDTDESRNLISEIQSQADRIFSAFGDSVPRPMQNESAHFYERRVASKLKSHSPTWANHNLRELNPDTLKIAASQIFKDAWDVATSNSHPGIPGGGLREVRRKNESGHLVKEYYGNFTDWAAPFMGGRQIARFNLDRIKNNR